MPAVAEVLAKSGVEAARARTLLEILLREKRLVRINDELVFHRSAIESLRRLLAGRKAQRFSVAAFKEWTGVSRKYAIPAAGISGPGARDPAGGRRTGGALKSGFLPVVPNVPWMCWWRRGSRPCAV